MIAEKHQTGLIETQHVVQGHDDKLTALIVIAQNIQSSLPAPVQARTNEQAANLLTARAAPSSDVQLWALRAEEPLPAAAPTAHEPPTAAQVAAAQATAVPPPDLWANAALTLAAAREQGAVGAAPRQAEEFLINTPDQQRAAPSISRDSLDSRCGQPHDATTSGNA